MFKFLIDWYEAFFDREQSKGMPSGEIHEMKKTLEEDYFVPGHEPRVNSSLYNRTHDDLIKVKDTPCFICGVSNSTLNDSTKNLVGAKQIETHHFIVEWSLANAVDWHIIAAMHSDFPDWSKVNFDDQTTYFNFVDHEYNMLCLCDVHHRGKYRGIHAIEYPVWLVQKFVKSDFKYIPDSPTKGMEEDLLPDMD